MGAEEDQIMLFDINKVTAEAQKELTEERLRGAKIRIKAKLTQIDTAKTVLANLEREYADLVAAIAEGN
jgi:hypothetical protein